jgi:hypothetical protein
MTVAEMLMPFIVVYIGGTGLLGLLMLAISLDLERRQKQQDKIWEDYWNDRK